MHACIPLLPGMSLRRDFSLLQERPAVRRRRLSQSSTTVSPINTRRRRRGRFRDKVDYCAHYSGPLPRRCQPLYHEHRGINRLLFMQCISSSSVTTTALPASHKNFPCMRHLCDDRFPQLMYRWSDTHIHTKDRKTAFVLEPDYLRPLVSCVFAACSSRD